MNEQRRAVVREVSDFIQRAAPTGGIEWAKRTEPHKSRIERAREMAMDPMVPIRTAMKSYAAAFFAAFNAFFELNHPEGELTEEAAMALPINEIWHAGDRLKSVEFKSPAGPFAVTPRRVSAAGALPSFSAAEMALLQVIEITDDLLKKAELIDEKPDRTGMYRAMMGVKRLFPGAMVVEVRDQIGDTHRLLPVALQD